MYVGQIRELLLLALGERPLEKADVGKVKNLRAAAQDRVTIEMEDGSTFDLVIHKTSERFYDPKAHAYGERPPR